MLLSWGSDKMGGMAGSFVKLALVIDGKCVDKEKIPLESFSIFPGGESFNMPVKDLMEKDIAVSSKKNSQLIRFLSKVSK